MENSINLFMHNAVKSQTYFKNLAVFTSEEFWSMFANFTTLCMKALTIAINFISFLNSCRDWVSYHFRGCLRTFKMAKYLWAVHILFRSKACIWHELKGGHSESMWAPRWGEGVTYKRMKTHKGREGVETKRIYAIKGLIITLVISALVLARLNKFLISW